MRLLAAIFLLTQFFVAPADPPNANDKAPAEQQPPKKADPPKKKKLTDKQIKRILIKQSIDEYPGNCPCPYNYVSHGSKCGGRSAWSRGGG